MAESEKDAQASAGLADQPLGSAMPGDPEEAPSRQTSPGQSRPASQSSERTGAKKLTKKEERQRLVNQHLEHMESEKRRQKDKKASCARRQHQKNQTSQFKTVKSAIARSSVSSTWFGDKSSEEMDMLNGVGEMTNFCPGGFVDFLERSRSQEMNLIKNQVKKSSELQKSLSHSSQSGLKQMIKRFNFFKSEVHYEKLKGDLMDVLLRFWRALGDKKWAPQGLECWKKHARHIVKGKQKRKCLIIDANFYELQYKLKHPTANGLEHQDERQDRLRDFFKQYHDSQSKVDLLTPCSDGQLRLVDSDPKVAQSAFARSLSSGLTPKSPSEIKPGAIVIDSSDEPLPCKVDMWKTRHARAKGTSLGECGRKLGMSQTMRSTRSLTLPEIDAKMSIGRELTLASGFSGSFGSLSSPLSNSTSSLDWTPKFGASLTLTGGWGLEGRWPRDTKRPQMFEVLTRVEKKLHPDRWQTTESNEKQLRRADKAFRGAPANGSCGGGPSSQSGGRPNSRGQLLHSESAPMLRREQSGGSSPSGHLSQKERGPFAKPWRGSSVGAETAESPTSKYLRETELNGISPKLIPFVTGHSNGLNARNQSLNDCDLLAIGTMVSLKGKITEVDLHENPLLSEKSLVPFLKKLYDQPVDKLSLNHCLHYALPTGIKETLEVVQSLISDSSGLKWLRSLDLSGIAMGLRTHVPLCQAIQEHPRLTDVRLADTGIGGSIAKECISQLMSSTSIEILDLSWNSFTPEVFKVLGERLAGMYNLLSLSISNCSSSQAGLDNPVAYFMESLSRNSRLTHVDVSTNRISFRGALVIEDALEQHRKLTDLTISNNPIGVLGMRSLLRLLARDSSGLVHIIGEGVAGGTLMEALGENMQVFRASSPGQSYNLNLARPYHRSLLRMLYKTCDRFGITPASAFQEISFSERGTYQHATKDADGIYVVPQEGKLSFIFNIVSLSDGPLKKVASDDFETFLSSYEDRARLKVGFKKVVPMFAYWKDLEGQDADQIYMLEALCKDFSFTWDQIEVMMCLSRGMIKEILWRLMPCIIGGASSCFLPTRKVVSMDEFHEIYVKAGLLEVFNAENPTGHYKLDLENPSDHLVAERLILLDRWEVNLAAKLGKPDISQKGNMSHVRNERFQDLPIQNTRSIMEWGLPEFDYFELDYVSGKRPLRDAAILDDSSWKNVLVAVQQADCSQAWQLQAFRYVSHHLYVSAIQLRQLLNVFADEAVRMDVFVLMYLRVVDIVNEKIFRVRFDAVKEVLALRNRLGHVTCFPYIQPEQAYFEFEFAHHDHRLTFSALLQLAAKESRQSYDHIHDFEYRLADGTVDPLPLGIPPSWSYYDKAPTTGTFKCTYVCAPEERKLAERKRLMEQHGFWQGPESEDDVDWWAAIGEAPAEVIDFLDFLVLNYNNVSQAFTDIDGPDGNRKICLKEFEDGMARMDCPKFKGKKKDRVTLVFRYLDPSGEGQISVKEWTVLDQLFKEIHMSIGEFVWFLDRTFDDLDEAWDFLDDDNSGSLSLKEWMDAAMSIGYFGQAKSIFSYLDVDGEGSISFDEFSVLKDFQQKRGESKDRD